jgi:hypothetical protein
MITHACRFESEAAALAALAEFTAQDDDGGATFIRSFVDPIGTIYTGTGTFQTDPETGDQVEVMAAVEGWNVNVALPALRTDLPGLVGAWAEPGHLLNGEHPVTPVRVWG